MHSDGEEYFQLRRKARNSIRIKVCSGQGFLIASKGVFIRKSLVYGVVRK